MFIGLVGFSPVFLLDDNLVIQGAVTAYTAITLFMIALSIRPGEGDHLFKVFRPVALLALAIPIWMVIQILPLPIGQFVHPIWLTAKSALDQSFLGSLSIDRGATLLALCHYCLAIGIVFVATAVTIDRSRAELILICLTALTTLAAVLVLTSGLAEMHLSTELISSQMRTGITAFSALGVVISLANIVRAIERYETRRTTQDISRSAFVGRIIIFVVGLLVCSGAIATFSTPPIWFATAGGFATFIIIVVVRRLGLRPWENAAIIAVAAVTMIIISLVNLGPGELSLQFAKAPASQTSIALNAMSNTPWAGNGAGLSVRSSLFIAMPRVFLTGLTRRPQPPRPLSNLDVTRCGSPCSAH